MQYCPNGVGLKPNHLNLFSGWGGIAAAKGDCALMLDHILHVVAAGDADKAKYLLDWLAHILQEPTKKPGVCIVLGAAKALARASSVQSCADCLGQRTS